MRNYLVEFIGTFFLVLVIGLTSINPGTGVIAPLAIGAVLMVMIYAGGHLSGAHYNPAVTIAAWIRGKCPSKDVLPYIASQVLAGIIAATIVTFLKQPTSVSEASLATFPALVTEFLFTFALVYVVLNTTTSKQTEGNSYYGLAIGFTIMVGAFAGGPISGGVYNPAVAVGISTMGLSAWNNLWIYLLGTIAGGSTGALVYKVVNQDE
ncbi:MAG: aquaporin [Acidobacteriia bacterium]|jgi:aquaporin Z|nr:aquaporin [Terriglobia bacterium]